MILTLSRYHLELKMIPYKFLKSILNFEVKWHGFNFIDVYNKMTKFTDPTARRKEMSITHMRTSRSLYHMLKI